MLRFIISLAALTAGIAIVEVEGTRWQWFAMPSFSLEILLTLFMTTSVIFWFLSRPASAPSFTARYLLSIVCKMLLCGIFVLILIFRDKAGANANAALFIIAYLLFTALEVGFLFKKINCEQGPKK